MEHKMMHQKTEIESQLEMIGRARLFGDGRWLVDAGAAGKLHQMLRQMGLNERVSDNSWRKTTLGKEVNLDLHMVFMGLWEPSDMVNVLEDWWLLDPDEIDDLYALIDQDEE